MTIGYVFKAQYFLPYNVTHVYPLSRLDRSINDDEFQTISDDDDDKAEVNGAASDVNDGVDVDDDDDAVRWTIYHALENFLRQQMKIDGRQCVLRAICEASQLSFAHESGLLGELLHIIFMWARMNFIMFFNHFNFFLHFCSDHQQQQ